jgi:hypothetical protein
VTQEFLSFGKPVVNICFDAVPEAFDKSARRFWEASFYTGMRSEQQVKPSFDLDAAVQAIQSALGNQVIFVDNKYSVNAVKTICATLFTG